MAYKKDLATGLIASSLSKTATTLVLQSGYGAAMPPVPFFLTLTPAGQLSTLGNSEIVRVVARSGDTLTINRAQKGTAAKAFSTGDIAANGVYTSDVDNNNVVQYYGFYNYNAATGNNYFTDAGPSVTITTSGGTAIEAILNTGPFYVNVNTSFVGFQINGVDYEIATVSNGNVMGYGGRCKTPALPAGTYTVKLRFKAGGSSVITLASFISTTMYAREVAA